MTYERSEGGLTIREDAAHQCHFCGEWVVSGIECSTGDRHWLSDCRPDLVRHEPGPLCTWHDATMHQGTFELPNDTSDCYAYQDLWSQEWTQDHDHFYEDGPT